MGHGACVTVCVRAHARVHTRYIAKTGLLLSRGREDFSDFESSVLRLKSTHVADCKPQAPPGRRWDFALELGLGLLVQNIREPAGWLRS